jgi:DtxR family Mn-dependent transcriptional regulator
MSADLSPTMRDYLAEIYRLNDQVDVQGDGRNTFVSTSALADLLDVSAPAVNRMVTKLREMGLLEHEPYKGITLTDIGRREALKQLRRQRIIEAFLVRVMGFGWHEVHAEAANMSKSLGDVLIERMLMMAGNPTRCPHGEPIATPEGEIPEQNDFLLTQAAEKQPLVLTRVRTRERDRLEYLAALGLMPETRLEVLHMAPFNGPLQLRVGKEYRIIGHNLAEMVRVQESDSHAD